MKLKRAYLKCLSMSLMSELRLGILVIINVRDQHSPFSSSLRLAENLRIMQMVNGKYNMAIVTCTHNQGDLKNIYL